MAPAELRGLRALVTGASKGIGYAVANRLHVEGATVLATARTAPSLPDGIQFIAADLVSVEGCGAVTTAVRDRLGGIDIVVHVVGGSSAPAGGFAVLDDEEWHRALDLNLFPAVRMDRALLPMMLAQGSGVIVHITSIQSGLPKPPWRTTARGCRKRSARKACVSCASRPVGSKPMARWDS